MVRSRNARRTTWKNGPLSLRSQLFVNDALECLERLCSAQHAAVDEEGWCARDAGLVAGMDVVVDLALVLPRIDARVELCGVEPELGRVPLEILVGELRLIPEQLVMKWPE